MYEQNNKSFALRASISAILVIALIAGIIFLGNYATPRDYDSRTTGTTRIDFDQPSTKFDFKFTVGSVKISTTSGTPYMTVNAHKSFAVDYKHSKDTYEIKCGYGFRSIFGNIGGFITRHAVPQIEVFLSEDMLERVEIEVSAGDVDVTNLKVKKAEFEVSAGKLEVRDCVIYNIESDVSAGEFEVYVNDEIQSIKTEVSAGKADIYLPKTIASFDINYHISAGSINDRTSFDLSNDFSGAISKGGICSYNSHKGNDKPIPINLDVSAGNITLNDY